MPAIAWVDGALGGRVSPFDAGFLYGESVWETMRAAAARVIDRDAHVARLAVAARALGLALPAALDAAIDETLAAAAEPHARVRAIVTPTSLVITAEPCAALSSTPLALAIVDVPLSDPRTLDPTLKTGSYLPNRRALAAARGQGGDEAVRLGPGGAVASGATSNLFAVIDGVLVTPPLALGLRDGVTRARVRALAPDAIERTFGPDELARASEAFVTSSIRGVAPAAQLLRTGGPVVWPAPGPRTREIAEAYLAFASRGAG
jgi:branched-chain amino acid aminotransferase